MSILVKADEISQEFQFEKDWFIGRTILLDHDDHPTLNHLFNLNSNEQIVIKDHQLREVERIHNLSQQLIEKPNRTCLSDVFLPTNDPYSFVRFRPILPSQDTIFELAREKPDNSRWTSTFYEHHDDERQVRR